MPAMCAMAASDSGARPRFVWTITPVALMTFTSDGAHSPLQACRNRRFDLGRDI